jgi:hypothetical protein
VVSRSATFSELCGELLEVYRQILGERSFEDLKTATGPTSTRLDLIQTVQERDLLSLQTSSIDDAVAFLEALLDCVGLASATQDGTQKHYALTIGDPAQLGRSRYRRGILKGGEHQLLDWHFSVLVQGWAHSRGKGPLKDLRHQKQFKEAEGRICDYMLNVEHHGIELLECKRFHPGIPSHNPLEDTVEKILDRIPDVVAQFDDTEKVISGRVVCRHLLVDISAYHNEPCLRRLKTRTLKVFGYEGDVVEEISARLKSDLSDGVDKITLCWRNFIFIDEVPRALVQRTLSTVLRDGVTSVFGYEGWTVAGYPRKETDFGELRVSSTARSLAWISTTYNNLSDPKAFYRVGPEVVRQEKPSVS